MIIGGFIISLGIMGLFFKMKILGIPVQQTTINFISSISPTQKIQLIISDKNWKKLSLIAEDAHERGYILQPEKPYVKGEVVYLGDTIECEVRLKGKMLDHVSGSKWSFRIKFKKNNGIEGIRRFSLQHPGTRNYSWDWFYHQWGRLEGLVHLRYFFVSLQLNNDDLGVYALEENFDYELLEYNQRPKGLIFRFNPDLYWMSRQNEMKSVYPNQVALGFNQSNIEAFSKGTTYADEELRKQLTKLGFLLEEWKTGRINGSSFMDYDKMAKRYAMLDLLGGYHSVDWSDLKFYYNPQTNLIEPICYESFGGRFIDAPIGLYRFGSNTPVHGDFHQLLFNDSVFFEHYIKYVESYSSESYIGFLQESLDSTIKVQDQILHSEFPYKSFSWEVLDYNSKVLKSFFDLSDFANIHLQAYSSDSILLRVKNIQGLPLRIKTIYSKIDSVEMSQIVPAYIPSKENSMDILIESNLKLTKPFKQEQLRVRYSVLGGERDVDTYVLPYPLIQSTDSIESERSYVDFKSMYGNRLENNIWRISDSLTFMYSVRVPKEIKVVVEPLASFKINSQVSVIFEGGLHVLGTSENHCSVSVEGELQLNNSKDNKIVYGDLSIIGKGKLNIIESGLTISSSSIYSMEQGSYAIESYKSDLKWERCSFLTLESSKFIKSYYSQQYFNKVSSTSYWSKFMNIVGGEAYIQDAKFSNCRLFLDATNHSKINIRNSQFLKIDRLIDCNDGVFVYMQQSVVKDVNEFAKTKSDGIHKATRLLVGSVDTSNIGNLWSTDKKSMFNFNQVELRNE